MSNYFISHLERSKGFRFYALLLRNIFEMGIVTFFEDVEFGGRNKVKDIEFKEESISFPYYYHS